MDRIRVLEVIRQGQIGGGESHLLDLAYFLDKERFEPIALSFTTGEMVDRLEDMGVKCHVIPTMKAFDPHVQGQITDLLRREKIQLVHAHGSRAASNMLWPAHRMKLPFVYTVHGWSFHDDQSWAVKNARAWSEKLICHFADRVICVSKSNADTGRQAFGLKQADIIENGINLERFNPDGQFADLRQTFGFSNDDFVAGFIARCTKQKSPLDFLEAVRLAHQQKKDVKGLFVAEGDMDAEVDAYIALHQMADYVYRSKFRTDVPDLLHCIDAYCLPSLWEGLSIALLEAMAMRKAIIATPTDGTKELLTDGVNGLMISFEQPRQLADTICRFCSDQALLISCGKQAHDMVEQRFNAKRVAVEVGKIYSEIIRK